MSETFYVIDGHSQIFRAYYAPFRELTSPTGEPTKATYVFTTMLLGLLQSRRPDYVAMALDSPHHTLERCRLFAEYKATREAPPEDLAPQVERIEQIVRAMGIPIWQGGGLEADDYLATAADRFADSGVNVVLVSGDKDMEQLIGEHVVMYDPLKDKTIDAETMEQTKGYLPAQAVEIQILSGDSTDNVPGVRGIGPKTAVKLIQKYGSADAVVAHADELTPKQRENVLAFAEQLPITRQLITLRRDVDIDTRLDQYRWAGLAAEAVVPIFRELGFSRLISQIEGLVSQAPAGQGDRAGAVTRPASPAEGPDRESPAMEADGAYTPGERPTTAADFDYRLIDSAEALAELAASLAGVGLLSVDTETTSTRPVWAELVGISLAWRTGVGYYVPIRGPMGAKVLDTQLVRSKLGPILADPNVRKVGHNLKYDCIVLARAGMPLKGIHFDTYLAARLLDADAPGKLDDVAMRMLNHRCIPISDLIGSGARAITMDQVPTDIVATYAAEDAEVTLRLTEALQSRLQDEQLAGLLGDVELPLLTVLAEMELAGVRVDRQELKRQAAGLGKQADALRDRIMVLAGEPFNPDSPKQLAEILFGKFKLPVLKKTKTGPSTDADVLEELGVVHELPAVVLEYRQLTKLLGTYLGSLAECIFPGDGRVHASFNQAGTVTGRLSSSSPNLQNIPIRSEVGRRIRAAFVAEPGWVLLSADYSQVELRILAHLCQDATLMAAFAADEDIHRIVAAEVFAVPAEDVTPEQRARAKTVNFGIIYGQTAHGLARTLRIGRTEAQEFITAYKGRFPAIEAFLAECVEQAKRCGYVETILNRRRAISEIASRNAPRRAAAERMAINSVVQGSAADLIKLAMVNIHRRISAEGRPSRMLLQIHDELVFEIPQADLPAEQAMVVEEMTSAMTLRVPLKVDTGTGVNWMQAK